MLLSVVCVARGGDALSLTVFGRFHKKQNARSVAKKGGHPFKNVLVFVDDAPLTYLDGGVFLGVFVASMIFIAEAIMLDISLKFPGTTNVLLVRAI